MNSAEHYNAMKRIKIDLINLAYQSDPTTVLDIFALAALHGDIETVDFVINNYGDKFANRKDEMIEVRNALQVVLEDMPEINEEQDIEAEAKAATDALLNKFML
jgi:hypothetical protein